MKKNKPRTLLSVLSPATISILLMTVVLILLPQMVFAQNPITQSPASYLWSKFTGGVGNALLDALLFVPGWLSIVILKLATLLTYLSGLILNYVVWFTVINMSNLIKDSQTINLAWGTIRDVANMSFIFVLLYAAITTILGVGQDNKKVVVRVVIVAILLNFSLFFTRLVIDAANILAVFFYDAIAPGALGSNISTGISNSLMDALNIQSIYDATGGVDGSDLLIIGVMGTVLALIAAFVFFAVALMFVIRFVVLIFTMILSPIAFMAYILPQLKKYKDQWWDALSGQAFFAPLYFLLTWIVIVVSRGLISGGSAGNLKTALGGVVGPNGERLPPDPGSIAILVNFIIVIALLITSLVIAKELSNRAGSTVSSLTKWATGAAGTATFGGVGYLGRRVIGSRAAEMAESDELKKRAAAGSRLAQFQLYAANKAASKSFDLRNTSVGNQLDAGRAKTGGFIQEQKELAKRYEKYKPSGRVREEAERRAREARSRLEEAQKSARERAEREISKHPELIAAEEKLERARREAEQPIKLVGLSPEEETELKTRQENAVRMAEEEVRREQEEFERRRSEFIDSSTRTENVVYSQAIAAKEEIDERMKRMADRIEKQGIRIYPAMTIPIINKKIGEGRLSGLTLSGRERAKAIRMAAGGKSRKEIIAELMAAEVAEKGEQGKTPPERQGGSAT